MFTYEQTHFFWKEMGWGGGVNKEPLWEGYLVQTVCLRDHLIPHSRKALIYNSISLQGYVDVDVDCCRCRCPCTSSTRSTDN